MHRPLDTGAMISIHALREEGDDASSCTVCKNRNFYPRPPRGGRRNPGSPQHWFYLFLSTPSARRATLCLSGAKPLSPISIHALREEGDGCTSHIPPHRTHFYPRPPRGGRLTTERFGWCSEKFLSTPSARRATDSASKLNEAMKFLSTPSARRATARGESQGREHYISIHALREEGDRRLAKDAEDIQKISIHALREEGDRAVSPCRAGTPCISIHALREEGDSPCGCSISTTTDFYPRPPRGGRLRLIRANMAIRLFLSTPSARRATRGATGTLDANQRISIHALREEGDKDD